MKRMTLAALTLTVLAGCASTDSQTTSVQTASRDDYTPLGSYLPRKKSSGPDDRTYADKEEFRRAQEMARPDTSMKN